MKFLCVPCDQAMKLTKTLPQAGEGTLSVLYQCPECGRETAMLTNPHETQLVKSLGVKIGPNGQEASKCPFSSMFQGDGSSSSKESTDEIFWSEVARKRLANLPEMIRPMAKMGIEQYAKSKGIREVNEKVLEDAKESFGMS